MFSGGKMVYTTLFHCRVRFKIDGMVLWLMFREIMQVLFIKD